MSENGLSDGATAKTHLNLSTFRYCAILLRIIRFAFLGSQPILPLLSAVLHFRISPSTSAYSKRNSINDAKFTRQQISEARLAIVVRRERIALLTSYAGKSAWASLILLFTKTEFHNQAIMKRCTLKAEKMISCNCKLFIRLFVRFLFACMRSTSDCESRCEINRRATSAAFSLFFTIFILRRSDLMNRRTDAVKGSVIALCKNSPLSLQLCWFM